MTQASYQRKQEERLERAINTLTIYDDCGLYAVVPSLSDTSKKPYIVGIDAETLYATSCTCKGAKKFGLDCLHQLATDRALDEERANRAQAKKLANRVGTVSQQEAVETLRPSFDESDADEIAAKAEAVNMAKMVARKLEGAYVSDTRTPKEEMTYCRHCGKPSRSGLCYRCNQY